MMYRELTGLKKPVLDKSNILHWPLFFFCMQRLSPVSDFIQDFCEIDMFSVHLDMIFAESQMISHFHEMLKTITNAGPGHL
ncbi:hypothetical protein P8452_18799 [Trifolium repens]|nr:hypothetical protein P8452_18799 [Trifolium repens]